MTPARPKSFYRYKNGYINIDECRVYFSPGGNWAVLKSAQEKISKGHSLKVKLKRSLLTLLVITLLYILLRLRGDSPDAVLLLGIGAVLNALYNLFNTTTDTFFVEKHKISSIEADNENRTLSLTFTNASAQEETLVLKGLSESPELLIYHPFKQSITDKPYTERDMNLVEVFKEVCLPVTDNEVQVMASYEALVTCYNEQGRYYHNMEHLIQFYKELISASHLFTHWPAVIMAMFYHDVVYNPERKDNELQSALFAEDALQQLGFSGVFAVRVKQLILATQTHEPTDDEEINLFVDADLSVLGGTPEEYARYAKQIREEYQMYSDSEFNIGRKAVLDRMLKRSRIYSSNWFYQRYEGIARYNLTHEWSVPEAYRSHSGK